MSCLVRRSVSAGDVLQFQAPGAVPLQGGGLPSSGRKQTESEAVKIQGQAHGSHPAKCHLTEDSAYQERADIIAAKILPSCVSHGGCFQNGGRVT